MSKRTPGPWTASKAVNPDNTGGYDYAIVVDGQIIAEVFKHTGWTDKQSGKYCAQPVEDNARLIAAAPELLEALENLLRDVVGGQPDPYGTMKAARAAVAKARGEA